MFAINREIPGVRAPMHGIDFGQMTPKCTSGPHLNSADRFHIGCRLNQSRITGRLSRILSIRPKNCFKLSLKTFKYIL